MIFVLCFMMEAERFELQSYIRAIDDFPQSDGNETLGSVLQHVFSCHDTIFVFDSPNKKKNLVGMISAYQALYRQSYPYTKVVANCYIHPPDIQTSTSIYKVLEVMRDTGFFALPVFDDSGTLLGAVNAKDILKGILLDEMVQEYVSEMIKPRLPVTMSLNAVVKDIQNELKNVEQSRVVVVDDEGKVAGIVTRVDLAHAFLKPTEKQRFSHRGPSGEMAYDAEEVYRHDEPIRKFMNETVYAVNYETPIKKIVSDLVDSDFNSVILIDILEKPVGFLSILDIIDTLVNIRKPIEVPIVFPKPDDILSQNVIDKSEDLVYRFIEKFAKRQSIIKVELGFKTTKYADGDVAEFDITLMVDTTSGKKLVAHSKGKDFLQTVREVIHEVDRQEERMPRHRKNADTKERLLNMLAP